MNVIHYSIKHEEIARKLIEVVKAKIEKTFCKETLILIEPDKADFQNIVSILYHFFKDYKLDVEDYVYIYNFSGYDENQWYCEVFKKKGLKRISSSLKYRK